MNDQTNYSTIQRLQESSSSPAIVELEELVALIRSPLPSFHLPQLLARIFRIGAHRNNFLTTVLIGRLRRSPEQSIRLLRLLRRPNILPFNAAIRALSESSPSAAISLFLSLKRLSLSPNDFTFVEMFRACSLSRNPLHVFQLHAVVIKSSYSSDPFVYNSLLSAYAKGVEHLSHARKVFDEMPERGQVRTWTCLIAGYARSNDGEEALSVFVEMIRENLSPEDDTMVSVLSACSALEGPSVEKWLKIFDDYAGIDSAIIVLMHLFAKLGKVEEIMGLFEKMRKRGGGGRMSIVAWNTVIIALVQNGEPVEALNLFHNMLTYSSPKPNHVTVVSLLSACATVGDLNLGRRAHEYMKNRGVLSSNRILGTAFIDMYSKCGSLEDAKEVFDGMSVKDVVSFNAMIIGLAMNGEETAALNLFYDMGKFDVRPNDGTLLGVLCACAHSGRVDEGRLIFNDMRKKYSMSPTIEHYACFVNLLARAGLVEEALKVAEGMPIEPNGMVWGSLLGACLVHFKVDVAREVCRRFFEADPENSAGYVMMSNIYAVDRSWEDIDELRGLMKMRGVRKLPGCSWIRIDGTLHEFHAGFSSSSRMEVVHFILNSLSTMVFIEGV